MKIQIDVDCTPQEARAFFGLPEVGPLQDAILDDMRERMQASLGAMDAEALMKMWMPANIEAFEKLQKSFWSNLTAGADDAGGKKGKK